MQHQEGFLRRGRCKLATGQTFILQVKYLSWKTFATTQLFHMLPKDHFLTLPLVSFKSDSRQRLGHCCLTAVPWFSVSRESIMNPNSHPRVRAVTWLHCSSVQAPLVPADYAVLVFRLRFGVPEN